MKAQLWSHRGRQVGTFFLSFLIVFSKEAVIFPEFELFTTYLFLPLAYFSSYLKVPGKVLLYCGVDIFPTELSVYLLWKRRCGSERGSVTVKFVSNRAVKKYNPLEGEVAKIN